jgi:1-acyl-sn-glycerol-3-phosphate acyltransferase
MKPIKRLLEALWGLYSLAIFALLVLPLVIVLALVPSQAICRRLVQFVARAILLLCGIPLVVRHPERIPQGPCVLIANHASYLDGVALAAALPARFSFVIKQEIRKMPGAHLLLRRIGSHFVERFDRKRGAADARRILRSAQGGQALMFFPEGTFTRQPGLGRFRSGAFATSVRAGMPMVPSVIRGAREILPSGSWLPRPGRLEVIIYLPIAPNPLATNPVRELIAATRSQMLHELGEPDLAPEMTEPALANRKSA